MLAHLFKNFLQKLCLNDSEIEALKAMREFRDAKKEIALCMNPYKVTEAISNRTTRSLLALQQATNNLKD